MKNQLRHYLTVTAHKIYVARGLFDVALGLMWRAFTHDLSKLRNFEAHTFSQHIPMLRVARYGSPEYRAILAKMKTALEAHYGSNRHHPEHWKHGVHEMDIVDLCEMLADWAAATRTSPNGDLMKSIEVGQERFHTGSVMADVFRNTALFRWGRESESKRKIAKWVLWISTVLSIAYPAWRMFI